MTYNYKTFKTTVTRKFVVNLSHEEVVKVCDAGSSLSQRERLEDFANPYETVTTVKTVSIEHTKIFLPKPEKTVDEA